MNEPEQWNMIFTIIALYFTIYTIIKEGGTYYTAIILAFIMTATIIIIINKYIIKRP